MILQLSRLAGRKPDPGASETPRGFSTHVRPVRGGLAICVEATVKKGIEIRARFALLLNRAIEESFLLGEQVGEQYQVLRNLEGLSEEETREHIQRLEARLEALCSTAEEPVARHGEADLRIARFAFEYLRAEDYTKLGLEAPAEPEAFTRMGARRAVAYLYAKQREEAA